MNARDRQGLDVVAANLAGLAAEVARLREALDDHEDWHRGAAERREEAAAARRVAMRAVWVSAVSAAAAVASVAAMLVIR